MDPTKDNSDFAGPMNGRAFGTSGFSRLGKTLNEQRQAESEQRGVREGVQNFKRMERIGRRAYRDALRSGNSMGAFQVLEQMDKGGYSSGGIRQAGAVENRLMSQFESRKGMLSGAQGSLLDMQSFAQDLNRSALIRSGDESALQRAYDRGAGIGFGRDAIDRYLGRDATTAPAGSATPGAPAQPSIQAQATVQGVPILGGVLNAANSPTPSLPIPGNTPQANYPAGLSPTSMGFSEYYDPPVVNPLPAHQESMRLLQEQNNSFLESVIGGMKSKAKPGWAQQVKGKSTWGELPGFEKLRQQLLAGRSQQLLTSRPQ